MYRAKYNRNHEQANFLLSDLGRNVFLLKEADYYGNIYIFFPWGWQEIFTVQSEGKKKSQFMIRNYFSCLLLFFLMNLVPKEWWPGQENQENCLVT